MGRGALKDMEAAIRLKSDADYLLEDGRQETAYVLLIAAAEEAGAYYLSQVSEKLARNHTEKVRAAYSLAVFSFMFFVILTSEKIEKLPKVMIDEREVVQIADASLFEADLRSALENDPELVAVFASLKSGLALDRKFSGLYQDTKAPIPKIEECRKLSEIVQYLLDLVHHEAYTIDLFKELFEIEKNS